MAEKETLVDCLYSGPDYLLSLCDICNLIVHLKQPSVRSAAGRADCCLGAAYERILVITYDITVAQSCTSPPSAPYPQQQDALWALSGICLSSLRVQFAARERRTVQRQQQARE